MGIYLNPGNALYTETFNDTIFVDKSMLINELNQCIKKASKKICMCIKTKTFWKKHRCQYACSLLFKGL